MLRHYQDALALLLLDARVRERWRELEADPDSVSALFEELGLELDASECASLMGIPPDQLERAARGLADKRTAAVRATVPHTARLWPAFEAAYRELLARCPPRREQLPAQPVTPGASELLRLHTELDARLRRDALVPPWTAELFALELARACTRHDGRTRELRAHYPVHLALEAMDAGWLSRALEARPCTYRLDATGLSWRPAKVGESP